MEKFSFVNYQNYFSIFINLHFIALENMLYPCLEDEYDGDSFAEENTSSEDEPEAVDQLGGKFF